MTVLLLPTVAASADNQFQRMACAAMAAGLTATHWSALEFARVYWSHGRLSALDMSCEDSQWGR